MSEQINSSQNPAYDTKGKAKQVVLGDNAT